MILTVGHGLGDAVQHGEFDVFCVLEGAEEPGVRDSEVGFGDVGDGRGEGGADVRVDIRTGVFDGSIDLVANFRAGLFRLFKCWFELCEFVGDAVEFELGYVAVDGGEDVEIRENVE